MDDSHAEVEIKPQLKPRGSVAKEEDPKPSHQLYKLQIKSTHSTLIGAELPQAKNVLRLCAQGRFSGGQLFATL